MFWSWCFIVRKTAIEKVIRAQKPDVVGRLVYSTKWNEMDGVLGHLCAHIG